MSESAQNQSNNAKQASFNKNEKSKDVRTTNIQAAKGIYLHYPQLLLIASEPVSVPEEWIK